LAATIAASVAVGVGVALARAERERRGTRAQRSRERQFTLLAGEPLAEGLTRMALGQLDMAIELLAGDGGDLDAVQAVHETRKALKRARALIGLLADELGEQTVARESAVLRDAGVHLARIRDTEVTLSTLDGLLERHPDKLAHRRAVARLRARLLAERDRVAELALSDAAARARTLAELRAARGRVAAWSLADRDGMQLIEPTLKRLYRDGRRRHRLAAHGSGDRARAMHRWRKRVKDLRYAAEILDRSELEASAPRSRRRRGGRRRKRSRRRSHAQHIRRVARRADAVSELLGEEHDLVLLAAQVRERGAGGERVPPGARRLLLKLIARRRKRLRKQALRAGKRLYAPTPKQFLREVRRAFARAGDR
jgi:hypothetical protein